MNQKLQIGAKNIIDIKSVKRGGSGRLIDIKIDFIDSTGATRSIDIHSEYNIRQTLHPSFLYSSAFYADKSEFTDGIPGKFTLAFSLAPEFYRIIYKKNPRKFFRTSSDDGKLSHLIANTVWHESQN